MKKIAAFTAVLLCLLTVSCQTPTAAQREVFKKTGQMDVLVKKREACTDKVNANPKYQTVFQHMPSRKNLTISHYLDENMPTDEQAQLLVAISNDMAHCRELMIEGLMEIEPGIIPILTNAYYAIDLIFIDLIKQRITWGEANKRDRALRNEYMEKQRVFFKERDRELEIAHNTEIAQRQATEAQQQAAFNALAQWSYQATVLQQNQKFIGSLNRPATTNCTRVGNTVRCTSQ